MSPSPAGRWYSRTVWGVSDIERALAFYIDRLGFAENWRHVEEGRPLIVQVNRDECELILSTQWPQRVGHGVAYVELTSETLHAVRAEFEAKDVARDGWWGDRLLVVEDPDGNQLWFPCPNEEAAK